MRPTFQYRLRKHSAVVHVPCSPVVTVVECLGAVKKIAARNCVTAKLQIGFEDAVITMGRIGKSARDARNLHSSTASHCTQRRSSKNRRRSCRIAVWAVLYQRGERRRTGS